MLHRGTAMPLKKCATDYKQLSTNKYEHIITIHNEIKRAIKVNIHNETFGY